MGSLASVLIMLLASERAASRVGWSGEFPLVLLHRSGLITHRRSPAALSLLWLPVTAGVVLAWMAVVVRLEPAGERIAGLVRWTPLLVAPAAHGLQVWLGGRARRD